MFCMNCGVKLKEEPVKTGRFASDLYDCLRLSGYLDRKDMKMLHALLTDRAETFPDDKKSFLRYADDRFLAICSEAAYKNRSGLEEIRSKASYYLQHEYMLSGEWSDRLAESTVQAFALFEQNQSSAANVDPKAGHPSGPTGSLKTPAWQQENYMNEPTDILDSAPGAVHGEKLDTPLQPTWQQEEYMNEPTVLLNQNPGPMPGNAQGMPLRPDYAPLPQKKKKKKWLVGVIAGAAALLIICFLIFAMQPVPYMAEESIEIGAGGTHTIAIEDLKEGTDVVWSSSDPAIVSVDESGTITANEEGSAEITAAIEDEEIGSCTVKVNKLQIELEDLDRYLSYPERKYDGTGFEANEKLLSDVPEGALIYPSEGAACTFIVRGTQTEDVTWKSSDPSVFSVSEDDGSEETGTECHGTAKEAGVVTLTATVDGQTLAKKFGVALDDPEAEVLRVNKKELQISDKEAELLVTTGYAGLEVVTNDRSVVDFDFGKNWYASTAVVKVKKKGTGTATLTIIAKDKDGNMIDSTKTEVKVTCK